MTVCVECIHCKSQSAFTKSKFDYRCLAQESHEENIDSVTGEIIYKHNDNNWSTNKYPLCMDANNNGKCPLFKDLDPFNRIKEFLQE